MQQVTNDEGFSYKKLIKLLGMTTSAHDAEALSAIRHANSELDRLGKTWHEFIMSKIVVVADPFGGIPVPPNQTQAPLRNPTTPLRTPPVTPPPGGYYQPPRQSPRQSPPPPPPHMRRGRGFVNRFAGLCVKCKERVPVGLGEAYSNGTFTNGKERWAVEHARGGCPKKTPQASIRPGSSTISDLDSMFNQS